MAKTRASATVLAAMKSGSDNQIEDADTGAVALARALPETAASVEAGSAEIGESLSIKVGACVQIKGADYASRLHPYCEAWQELQRKCIGRTGVVISQVPAQYAAYATDERIWTVKTDQLEYQVFAEAELDVIEYV